MKELGRYLAGYLTQDFTPYFLVCEPKKYAFETSKMIPISRPQINAMSRYGSFEAVDIEVKLSGLGSQSMISLCLRLGDYKRTYSTEEYYDPNNFDDIPISGFPRKLMTEDNLASKLLDSWHRLWRTDQFPKEKNFRGLVSRVDDPYIDHTMSESVEQLRPVDRTSSSSLFRR